MLQQLDQGDDQATLGDQRAKQPFQKIGLYRLDMRFDLRDIGLGREIGVEQGDMLFGQGLGLFLGEAALRQTLDPATGIDEREVRLGNRSAGIEDAPQNGRGEREVESDHPLDQAQVGLGGEVFGQLLTQRCRHGFGLVIRETCIFELSREAKGVDRGGCHVSNPSTD